MLNTSEIFFVCIYLLKHPKKKIAEFANNEDPDEVAQHEPSYLNIHCLPSSHWSLISQYEIAWTKNFLFLNFVGYIFSSFLALRRLGLLAHIKHMLKHKARQNSFFILKKQTKIFNIHLIFFSL